MIHAPRVQQRHRRLDQRALLSYRQEILAARGLVEIITAWAQERD
jgi:hypothetical protein